MIKIINIFSYFKRFIGELGNILSGIIPGVSSENLQPTLGVSFGLPQNGPGYGGYAQNPLGTGPAVNPYYTAGDSKIGTDGLSVGPVNFNPLVSFQVK